jgi:hypothetical protein
MSADVVSFVHHIKMAGEHLESFCRDYSGSKGAKLLASYKSKVDWIKKDLLTHPFFPENVREGIRAELNSDVFAVPAINEKIALLNPQQREVVEDLIDTVLSGADLTVERKTD